MVKTLATRALLATLATTALLVSAPAHADDSSSLVLRGYVPISCNIDVAAAPAASNIPLANAQRGLAVAQITETCNNRNGYTVSVSSKSNGALEGPSARLAYRLQYGDAVADLEESATKPVRVASSAVKTERGGVRRDVRISHDGVSAGGAYADTITFIIAAK